MRFLFVEEFGKLTESGKMQVIDRDIDVVDIPEEVIQECYKKLEEVLKNGH